MKYSLFNNHSDQLSEYLSENNFYPQYKIINKLYYFFARPVLPKKIRQYIQKIVSKNIKFSENFILSEFVDYIKNNIENIDIIINEIYPDNNNSAIVLTHDVETEKGMSFISEVIKLESKYGFKSSWNIVPNKYKINEDIIRFITDSGHEIGIHGCKHDGKLYYSKNIFDKRVPYINEALKKYNAVGFRSPMAHRNLEWLQKLDILYDASCFDYDPFQPFPGGTGSIWPFKAGKLIELPYTIPQDHVLFYTLRKKDISIWKNKADWVAKNHGVILTLTHPDYLMEKDHLKLYEEFLAYLSEMKNAWHCLPKELAEYWKKKFED